MSNNKAMTAFSCSAGLEAVKRLDRRFNQNPKLAAHIGDVVGSTKASVPALADAGVVFLHIGANGGCSIADLPPLFKWQQDGNCADVCPAGRVHLCQKCLGQHFASKCTVKT